MTQIDLNQVYDGVTLALHNNFPQAKIYGDTVEQNLSGGDFNVLPVTVTHMPQIGSRVQRKALFDIIYYPVNDGDRTECLKTLDILADVLDIIQTPNGSKVHCLNFESTIEDDILHCIAAYPYFVYSLSREDVMEDIKTGGFI